MKSEVLKTFLALSTSASVTLKHSRLLEEREGGREGGKEVAIFGHMCIKVHAHICCRWYVRSKRKGERREMLKETTPDM